MNLTYADDEIINRDNILMAKRNVIGSAAKNHIIKHNILFRFFPALNR